MSLKQQMRKGLKWSTLGTFGLALFQLLQMAILARFLPQEAFGLIALAILVVNFTNIFAEMGLTSAIFYKQDASVSEYSSLFWLNILVSVFLYIILFFAAKYVALFYEEYELTTIIKILGLNIVFLALGKQHRAILQKKMQFDLVAKIDIFTYFIGLIVAIILVQRGMGVYSLVYSTLITSTLSSLLLIVIRFRHDPIKLHFSLSETRIFMKVGGFSLASNILDYFARQLDVIIIGKLLGTQFLGIYSLAKQVSLKAYSVLMPIVFNVFNPVLAALNKEKERMEEAFSKMIYILSNITFPIYLIIIFAASEILEVLYGEEYKEGTLTLVGLSVFQATFTIVKPAGSLQIATGRTDIGFIWTIFRNILTAFLLFIVAKYFNPNHIAFFLGGLGIVFIILLWPIQIKKLTKIGFRKYISQFIYPVVFLILSVLLKFLVLDRYIIINQPVISGLTKIALGTIFYISLIGLFDKSRLKSTLRKI